MARMRYLGNQSKILLRGNLGASEIHPGDIVEMGEAECKGCATVNDGRIEGEWERLPDPEPPPAPLVNAGRIEGKGERLPDPEPPPAPSSSKLPSSKLSPGPVRDPE